MHFILKRIESNLCDVVATSLCKLPCTQQNNSFPHTQINGPFMCSESGKQVYITSIHVYVCFFISIVYLHVQECSRREKSGKMKQNVKKKPRNLELVREVQISGKCREISFHTLIHFQWN